MTPLIMSETPTSRKQTLDRGYPPQHTAASEQEYEQRRRETKLEHRDRRPYQTPMSPAESYNRPRDDPKQVSARYVIDNKFFFLVQLNSKIISIRLYFILLWGNLKHQF